MLSPLSLRRGILYGAFCAGWLSGDAKAAFTEADFLKTDGPVIRAASGRGAVVVLRGTNLGGWLMQEDWMSPNGYGSVERDGWKTTKAGAAVLDGDRQTAWCPAADAGALEIDFGRPTTFGRLTLLANGLQDPAGELTVEVSPDGIHWRTAKLAKCERNSGEWLLWLDQGYTARRFRLQARGNPAAWSIAELNFQQNDDYTVRMALRRRFGSAKADELIDYYQRTWLAEGDLERIKGWGMNAVRVPMNWLQFVEPNGKWKPGAWQRLDWVVRECGERGIHVILDLHAVPGGASPWASSGQAGDDGTGQNPNGFWTDPKYYELTAEIWRGIAMHYRGNPVVAGYDLVNEPLYRFDELRGPGGALSPAVLAKSAMLDRLYRAVRAVDPDHIIFMPAFAVPPPDRPADNGVPCGFLGITPPSCFGWTNIVYQVHPYDMANPHSHAAQERLVEATLRDIAHYQREWNVPIYAGEYSLYAFYDVWAKWMTGLNALNVSWTNWAYKIRGTPDEPAGGDWGFFNSNASLVPDIDHDSAEMIAEKWGRFRTENFRQQSELVGVVTKYTR